MKKVARGSLVVVLGMAALALNPTWVPPLYAALWSAAKTRASYKDSVVFIRVDVTLKNGSKDSWTATGFIVSDKGFVLTSGHVVPSSAEFQEMQISGSVASRYSHAWPLSMLRRDEELDLALLKFPEDVVRWKPVKLGKSSRVPSDAYLFVLGFPLSFDLTSADGKLSNRDAPAGRWLTTVPLSPGYSGAPVFDDQGRVIAVAVGKDKDPKAQLINYLVPVDYAMALLVGLDIPQEPPLDERPADFEFDDTTREDVRKVRSYLDYPDFGTDAWQVDRELYFLWLKGRVITLDHYVGERSALRQTNDFVLGYYESSLTNAPRRRPSGLTVDLLRRASIQAGRRREFGGVTFYMVKVRDRFDFVDMVDGGSGFCVGDSREDYLLTSARFRRPGVFKMGFYTDRTPRYVRPILTVRGPAGAHLDMTDTADDEAAAIKNLLSRIPVNNITRRISTAAVRTGQIFDFSDRRFEEIFGLQVECAR